MKKWLYFLFLIVFFLVACSVTTNVISYHYDDEIASLIDSLLVEETVNGLGGNWVEYNYSDYDHLTPSYVVRTSIASNFFEAGDDFYKVYEGVYERLRQHFSNSKTLWFTYSLLKPTILEGIIERPQIASKLKRIFDEEFLQHLEGKSQYSKYLSQRWKLEKRLEDSDHRQKIDQEEAQKIKLHNDEIISLVTQENDGYWDEKFLAHWELEHNDFYLYVYSDNNQYFVEELAHAKTSAELILFQEERGCNYWGYAYDIPEKLGYAFDFRQRRISEGGVKLANTWARIARDIMFQL